MIFRCRSKLRANQTVANPALPRNPPGPERTALQASQSLALPSRGSYRHKPSVQIWPLSPQDVPLATEAWTHAPVRASQESTVQGLPSSHTFGVPAHTPDWHVGESWHLSSSVHGKPSSSLGCWHLPVCESHTPAVHGLPSSHAETRPLTQAPMALQLSPTVHGLLSLQAVPGANLTNWHRPVFGRQLSTVQSSLSLQVLGLPTHEPSLHASSTVQKLPSEHFSPPAVAVDVHSPARSQPSAVHGLPSLQLFPAPLHRPNWQLSSTVQLSPSLQGTSVRAAN